jgi:hypothetical protein
MINTAKTLSYDCPFFSLKPRCGAAAGVFMQNYVRFLFRCHPRAIFAGIRTLTVMIFVRKKRSNDSLN